ncbi:MAG: PhzF family phenazine biosynthesis protein [Planctomycetales bacterium]|nr:PhzF family phenazine biosynthesis protein [Planctomycetales bacterium]
MPLGPPIYHVDAFAEKPFSGNPAAVCLLPAPKEPAWMQAVAREMNLSETAFVSPQSDGWDLRWFTPKAEVDLCGHATLASAHVLWDEGKLPAGQPARFQTRSGLLTASRRGDLVELDFPASPPGPAPEPQGLSWALGTKPSVIAKYRLGDYLLEYGLEAEVRALAPDFGQLAKIECRGVVATARAGGTFDYVCRFFAPRVGVPEDPVTGSAQCGLAPWWGKKLGKTEMTGFQASERGGIVRVRLYRDRVGIAGGAVTVAKGHLLT